MRQIWSVPPPSPSTVPSSDTLAKVHGREGFQQKSTTGARWPACLKSTASGTRGAAADPFFAGGGSEDVFPLRVASQIVTPPSSAVDAK